MLKTFDLDKLFDLHLDPPSSENPPLCRITQDSKDAIITTDFYLANVKPKEWILPTPLPNNEMATSTTAAAASNLTPEIPPDPIQPGKLRLHSWMLYTPHAPVLDLRGQNVTSTLDLVDAFHQLHLCSTENDQMAEGNPKKPKSPNKQLSDSDTLDEEPIIPILKTSVEKRHYGTIPGSALATQATLSHSRTQVNPTVKRGPNHKVRVKKLPKEKATDKSTQTEKQKK